MFKGSFTREPYIDCIRKRNQISYLTRLRIGAHSLAIELGRRHRPITPIHERVCLFCQTDVHWNAPNQTCYSNLEFGALDDELHFLTACSRFTNTRRAFYSAFAVSTQNFEILDDDKKFLMLMCPSNPKAVKIVNRYIKFMFDQRGTIASDL